MAQNKILMASLVACVSAGAFAINFGTTAKIDGVTYTINGAGSPIQTIGSTISFSLPQAFVLSGTKTVELQYQVSAAPQVLTKVNQTSNIIASGTGSVKFDTLFVNGATNESTSSTFTGTNTPTFSYDFVNQLPAWNTVTTTLTLTAGNGRAKASIYNANYEAVPEPATLAFLASGLVGLAVRKRRK